MRYLAKQWRRPAKRCELGKATATHSPDLLRKGKVRYSEVLLGNAEAMIRVVVRCDGIAVCSKERLRNGSEKRGDDMLGNSSVQTCVAKARR